MRTEIDNTQDVIDSRDVIARIEELEETEERDEDEQEELESLKALSEEASGSPDWSYGESLIKEDYFTEYIEELINDCYDIPSSSEWPYRHMTLDFEAAADEAKQDYFEVDFAGETYLIRG